MALLKRAGQPGDRARPWAFSGGGLLTLAMIVYGMGAFFPAEAHRFRGWYGIDGHGQRLVREAGVGNSLVFVSTEDWTDYAPFFAQNRPTLDGEIVFAGDRGPVENPWLMALYPDRSYYLFSGDRLVRLYLPASSGDMDGAACPLCGA